MSVRGSGVRVREMIGEQQFSARREVFDQHDTVFLPSPPLSPALSPPRSPDVSNTHTSGNFRRNTPGYSSMREQKTEFEFRPRKYSDNFTSELNQSDDVDYRHSMTERNRRLSKLRRDFLNSNLHEPADSPFTRAGARASLPAKSSPLNKYKVENLNLHKFPFAEPYSTPTPTRKVIVDLDSSTDSGKENHDPGEPKHKSLPNGETSSKVDTQKLFEELVRKYSPQRKPVDWSLPPTRPRIVSSIPKSTSSAGDTIHSAQLSQKVNSEDDDVFGKPRVHEPEVITLPNGLEKGSTNEKERDSKVSLSELEENDKVPELSTIQRQISRDSYKKPHVDIQPDLTIPALIEKMNLEGDELEHHKDAKKVKRKRSFLDKLLRRNKTK